MQMVDSCIGSYSISVLFKNVEDRVVWVFFLVFMVQMMIVVGGFYGMSWSVFLRCRAPLVYRWGI